MKHKICYILPEYREDLATHFSYIGRLLGEASAELDIFLIIEKGTLPTGVFGCQKIKLIGSSNIFLRLLKMKFWIAYARFHGYHDFYVHYSFLAVVQVSLFTKFFGGRVFYWNCGEPWKYKRSFFREHFERLAYKLTDFLVTGTEKLGAKYAEHYGVIREKIKIMPNWIDTGRFKNVASKDVLQKELSIPAGKKVIFFVHHLSIRKGSRMILSVARDLSEIRKDFIMIIAGSGPDEKMLRSRVEKTSELSSFVHFVGAIPNRDIQKYFGATDVFFMPSQEEGFPRVVLEAMASSVSIVGSDVGSVMEIIPPLMKPYIVSSNNTAGFVKALDILLSQSKEETENIKTELCSRAEEFETEKVAKIFVKLFQ